MKRGLAVIVLTVGLAWAAGAATQTVEVLNGAGQVVATGGLSGHLRATGDLGMGRTLRVSTTVDGVTTIKTFVLAAPITARDPEAQRLGVRVGERVLTLEAALESAGIPARRGGGADDGPNHDVGDDHGGASGGHGADDGAGHDAGDDHGGGRSGGGHR